MLTSYIHLDFAAMLGSPQLAQIEPKRFGSFALSISSSPEQSAALETPRPLSLSGAEQGELRQFGEAGAEDPWRW